MSGYGKQYRESFNRLKYENKGIVNDISEYIGRKKLNAAAERRIMAEIAEKVLDGQNEDKPSASGFGGDWFAFCDRLCEDAPRASIGEKIAVRVRKAAVFLFLAGLAALAEALYSGTGILLSGDIALKVLGGVILAAFLLPLWLYRDGLHLPVTYIFPSTAPTDRRGLVSMIRYSLLCCVFAVAYILLFWLYPDKLTRLGLGTVSLNALLWVLISGAVLVLSYAAELLLVRRNYRRSYLQ